MWPDDHQATYRQFGDRIPSNLTDEEWRVWSH